jgi:cystathionine beta-lyase/cystathionine gamma-synthase
MSATGVARSLDRRASGYDARRPEHRSKAGVEESSDLFDDLDQALKRAHNA